MSNTSQLWSKLSRHFVLEMICHYASILELSGAFFGLLRGYNFQKTIWTTAITRGTRHKRKNIASKSCGDVPERKERIILKEMSSSNELVILSKTSKKCSYLDLAPLCWRQRSGKNKRKVKETRSLNITIWIIVMITSAF